MGYMADAHSEWHLVNGKNNAACPLDCMAGVGDYPEEEDEA